MFRYIYSNQWVYWKYCDEELKVVAINVISNSLIKRLYIMQSVSVIKLFFLKLYQIISSLFVWKGAFKVVLKGGE